MKALRQKRINFSFIGEQPIEQRIRLERTCMITGVCFSVRHRLDGARLEGEKARAVVGGLSIELLISGLEDHSMLESPIFFMVTAEERAQAARGKIPEKDYGGLPGDFLVPFRVEAGNDAVLRIRRYSEEVNQDYIIHVHLEGLEIEP